jgi:ssDNA-binding Zn-finger/Zn-ribbon topoisomerase 1
MITEVKCPNCNKTFEFKEKHEDTFDTVRSCPHCNWTVSSWCFDYIKERKKTFKESIM